ncbi:MAG: peptidoglycan editing factor PgeF [Oscillospiraceae bacterium]|nr:peptidoglycan editing factor PgeF [Oscillospiraceae bacterium]
MTFTQHNHNGVVYMTSPNIAVTHAFSTRFGGVSSGIFSTLNLGLNLSDERSNVTENYNRLCTAIGISSDDIVYSNQVHGTRIRTVSRNDCGLLHKACTTEQADGLVTNEPDVALMVFTADCVPILLHDPTRGVVGAVHAGWRGTAANIARAAVQKMTDEYGCNPSDIHAAIGPCISVCCFEVGDDVAQALSEYQECITASGEKYKADLKKYNRLILNKAGVLNISISDECTCCSNDKYWSHRYTKGERGSQVAIIKL